MTKSEKAKLSETEHLAFQDDETFVLENEFDQIRECIGMYIGAGESEGVMHLVNEIMTNAIDEATSDEATKVGIGNIIEFTFDERDCRFTITDNGRGIPLDKLMTMVGHKHASTKFGRKANRYSGGQNGVGMTVTAALSGRFEATCWRHGQTRSVHISGNELIDGGIKKCSENKHGSSITFAPDKRYIGEFYIECADVEDYLRRLSYILPKRVRIKYLGINSKGHETATVYKPLGLNANVDYLSNNLDFPPIFIQLPEVEVELMDKDNEFFELSFSFSYDRTLDEMVSASFSNYIATKDGGYHEAVVSRCIAEYFTKQCKDLEPNHKYEVITDDCRRGLVFAVLCDHSNPKFEGQHKSKFGQKDLPKHARKPILDGLDAYFSTNNAQLRKIATYLRQMAKMRLEMNKIKKVTLKKPSTFLDDADMKIFSNISDRNYSGYKELILGEGDSAISAVSSARNVKCQAVFAITGVVANTYGVPTAKVMQGGGTFPSLVKVLGCGIGEDFDITKLKWDAIIIATDKDVDGSNISSLLCTFFAYHMPGIVTAGRLYKVIPPLYLINTKPLKKYYTGRDYLFDKAEYYDLYNRIVADNLELALIKCETTDDMISGAGEVAILSRKEKFKFLSETVDYLEELRYLRDRSNCMMDVLESVTYFYMACKDHPKHMEEFGRMLHAKFPELTYDEMTEVVSGSYNTKNVALIVDSIYEKMAKRMMRMMMHTPLYVATKSKKDDRGDDPRADRWDVMTYGKFMQMCEDTFAIEILQRYKGLGESEAIMIFPSMMNPLTRKLVRINMSDTRRALEGIRELHGDGADMRETRRRMLAAADITLADIDN